MEFVAIDQGRQVEGVVIDPDTLLKIVRQWMDLVEYNDDDPNYRPVELLALDPSDGTQRFIGLDPDTGDLIIRFEGNGVRRVARGAESPCYRIG